VAPRRHWETTDPGVIEELVKNGIPMVLTGLSAHQLPALEKWRCASEEFRARLRKVEHLPVKVNRESNAFGTSTPMDKMFADTYMSNHFVNTHHHMWTLDSLSGEDFMGSVCTTQKLLGEAKHMHFHGEIKRNLPDMLADVERLGPLLGDRTCHDCDAQIWISSPGVFSPTHFDHTCNLNLQVDGYKQFMLFPPNATLHHYPNMLHPHSRQSQVANFEQIFSLSSSEFPKVNQSAVEEAATRFPHVRDAMDAASTALLGPGDVLFIPEYWNHLVFSLGSALGTERASGDGSSTGSISSNAWCSDGRARLEHEKQQGILSGLETMFSTIPLPHTKADHVAVAREFLAQVSAQMGYPGFAQFHFDDRYAPLVHPAIVEVLDKARYCSVFRGDEGKAKLAGAGVARVLKQLPAEKRMVVMGDLYDEFAKNFIAFSLLSKDSEVRASSDIIQFMKALSACGK